MQETELNRPIIDRHPAINLFLIIIVVGLAFTLVGPFIGLLIAGLFHPGPFEELTDKLFNETTQHPELKIYWYLMQGCATAIGLIIAPWMLMRHTTTRVESLLSASTPDVRPALVCSLAVITFVGLNSVFAEWNAEVHLPEFAKGIEEWARGFEDAATAQTKFLTTFDSPLQLIVALIVIAVLPALGEEIVFRGLIQSEIFRATKRVHLSIWLAAILFSAMHMQFFGFVPRLFLGALFGYLYFWSGNLWFAILAHFVNNALQVLALYFYQQGAFTLDPETTEAMPLSIVLFSTVLTGVLLYYFYTFFEHRKPHVSQL